MSDRAMRTVYRVTVADLDALAGRRLSEDEIEDLRKGIEHSSIPEALETVVDSLPVHCEDCGHNGRTYPVTWDDGRQRYICQSCRDELPEAGHTSR